MLLMAVLADLTKKLKVNVDDPRNICENICDKYEKKDNNKLSNICKGLESCTWRNTKVDPDDWFNYLSHLNNRVDNILVFVL